MKNLGFPRICLVGSNFRLRKHAVRVKIVQINSTNFGNKVRAYSKLVPVREPYFKGCYDDFVLNIQFKLSKVFSKIFNKKDKNSELQ